MCIPSSRFLSVPGVSDRCKLNLEPGQEPRSVLVSLTQAISDVLEAVAELAGREPAKANRLNEEDTQVLRAVERLAALGDGKVFVDTWNTISTTLKMVRELGTPLSPSPSSEWAELLEYLRRYRGDEAEEGAILAAHLIDAAQTYFAGQGRGGKSRRSQPSEDLPTLRQTLAVGRACRIFKNWVSRRREDLALQLAAREAPGK